MKAHVKVNITIHLEDETEIPDNGGLPAFDEAVIAARFLRDGAHSKIKTPLQVHCAGARSVTDRADAERVLDMIRGSTLSAFGNLSVVLVAGSHVPDLALAKGLKET